MPRVRWRRLTPVKKLIYFGTTSHCVECRQSLPFQMSVAGAQRAIHEPAVNNSQQPFVAFLRVPYRKQPPCLLFHSPPAPPLLPLYIINERGAAGRPSVRASAAAPATLNNNNIDSGCNKAELKRCISKIFFFARPG